MKRAIPALFVLAIMADYAAAQQGGETPPATPPAAGSSLPDVEVIQQQQPPPPQPAAAAPKPKPAAAQAKPKPKPVAAQPKPKPQPQPQPEVFEPVEPVSVDPSETLPNSPYGSPAAEGAIERAAQSAQTPVNPTQLIPSDLTGFSAAATNLSPAVLTERQPSNLNEALKQVPGVIIINDDANAHHGGVAVRGSPARRSRKMLVMEDGHPVNLALWLDPSVHYWGPLDRFESIEVIRGTVITHGPNNNFGVINARNISPFGPNETVVSSAIGFTKSKTGSFSEIEAGDDGRPEADDDATRGGNDTDISLKWHTHTRQSAENVGIVLSYSGANVQGLWDTERARVNDFYGALGWKGSSSDLTVSAMHARQRDNYDEQNFLGNYELGEFDAANEDDALEQAEAVAANFRGLAEQQFYNLKHCKTCFAPAATENTYTGEIWRGQIVHNAYLDDDTTLTSRVYAGYHRRDRYQLNTYESDPNGSAGFDPVFDPAAPTDPNEESDVFFGENTMFGRLRTFRHIGTEVRGEWANRELFGFNQALQAGIRYEYQDMTNRNFIGRENEILRNGDEAGATIFDRSLDANAVSGFLQTNISVASNFNVVPGIRFEYFKIKRENQVIAREESEAGGGDTGDCQDNLGVDDCLDLDGILLNPSPANESFDSFNALPGVAFAYTGLYRTTVFGGYHRGLTTAVLRNEDFPGKDEIGDNFNLGIRSSAVKGLDFEVAGFYQMLENYQFGASFSNVAGDRSFGIADKVEIGGVELLGRLNSRPFTGGSLNVFGEAGYTYSRGTFKDLKVQDDDDPTEFEDFSGNRIPEVPLHVAALTVGIEQNTAWRWDASMTWTYRGSFFTDEGNTPFGFGGELECEDEGGGEFECELEEAGEDGEVPSIWLLSARFNMDIGSSGASVFVAGDNLLDKTYISDREDGIKPGLGRTIWTGFKYKF